MDDTRPARPKQSTRLRFAIQLRADASHADDAATIRRLRSLLKRLLRGHGFVAERLEQLREGKHDLPH